MSSEPLIVSHADLLALDIAPACLRTALAEVFADVASGVCTFLPKSQLDIAPGHSFQSMMAVSHRWKVATVKWVAVTPAAPVHATICLNDLASGAPLAVMDARLITEWRTAALSALAANRMVVGEPEVLALVGCGVQARGHLLALCDLYPSIRRVLCASRSPASSAALAELARAGGLNASVTDDLDALLSAADMVVSTVPAAPGLRPLLDARKLKPGALALMVDLGRSWLPDSYAAFGRIVTDSVAQMRHPLGADNQPVQSVFIGQDLCQDMAPLAARQAFCFKGHAGADLAAVVLVYQLLRASSSRVS